MENWYVRNTAGRVFGPIDLETLKSWVKDGRVEPLAGISTDLTSWMIAPLKPELEMNWLVENNPGQFYGPTHRAVVDDLVKTGSLSRAARFYCDDHGLTAQRLRELENLVSSQKKELDQKDRSLAEMKSIAADKDDEVTKARNATKQRGEELSRVTSELKARDNQIIALQKQLQEKATELGKIKQDLNQKAEQLQQLTEELERREQEIADIKSALASTQEVHEREWKSEVLVPEVVNEAPPPTARAAFGFGGSSSLADLERRAQQELARMGAARAKSFFNLKK